MKEQKRRRWLIGAVVAIFVIVLAATLLLNHFLDEAYLEQRLTAALASPSDSLYRVEIGEVGFSLLRRSVSAKQLALHPDSLRLSQKDRRHPATRYNVKIASLHAGGISLWSLLFDEFQFQELHVVRPEIHLVRDQTESSESSRARSRKEDSSDGRDSKRSFHSRLARMLPPIAIALIRIDSAAFSVERIDGEKAQHQVLEDISIRLEKVAVDTAAIDSTRPLFSDNVQLRAGKYKRHSSGSLYRLEIAALSAQTNEHSLNVEGLLYKPTVSDTVFMQRQTQQKDRYNFAFKKLALQGIDYWRFLERGTVAIKSAVFEKPLVDVYHDRNLPEPPKRPVKLPHQSLQEIESLVCVDKIEIKQGTIIYSERSPNGERPGTVRFEDVWGTVYNVSNGPACKKSDMLAVIDARARLYDEALLDARIEYQLTETPLTIRYRGTVARTDPRIFNEMLVDLERTEITDGHVDSVWFDIAVKRDSAVGNLTMLYDHLKIKFMEKEKGPKGLLKKLIELIAGSKIDAQNPRKNESQPRVAAIQMIRKPELSIFTFMWFTLRQGLMTTIGL